MTSIKLTLNVNSYEIEETIRCFNRLIESHIEHRKCKEPDRCDEIIKIQYLISQLERGKKKLDELEIDATKVD